MINWKIFFDGACHNKVGQNNPMGIGIAVFLNGVYSPEHSNAIHAEGLNGELGTSNIAEWKGCVEAMRKACSLKQKFPGSSFQIYSDSEVITKQFNGDYMIREAKFLKYKQEADKWAGRIVIKKILWIPREQNKEADILSKQGLKEEV